MRSNSMCISAADFTNSEMDICEISVCEVVQGAPDRVNVPCLMHDTSLCRKDVQMTIACTEQGICK